MTTMRTWMTICIDIFAEQNDRAAAENALSQGQFHFLVGDAVDIQLVLYDLQKTCACDEPALWMPLGVRVTLGIIPTRS